MQPPSITMRLCITYYNKCTVDYYIIAMVCCTVEIIAFMGGNYINIM